MVEFFKPLGALTAFRASERSESGRHTCSSPRLFKVADPHAVPVKEERDQHTGC
jgi:hypothetical protein